MKQFLALLSDDPERAAELYLVLLGKLIRYFSWNICPNPEELADEVLDRVARRVEGGEQIQSPISYVLGVARRVLLESKPKAMLLPLEGEPGIAAEPRDDASLHDLDRCLEELEPESRAMLLEYYSADGGDRIRVRQEMADRMGLSVNALRNRCLRLRRGLEECMERRRRRQ
ncbi:MAG: sigma-70 family RNA polymerase sigma factor [Bryobacterales bacterium]|nr:sigma-70 family RNA polymerase sigma factor [Bryobacterales bacterium]